MLSLCFGKQKTDSEVYLLFVVTVYFEVFIFPLKMLDSQTGCVRMSVYMHSFQPTTVHDNPENPKRIKKDPSLLGLFFCNDVW